MTETGASLTWTMLSIMYFGDAVFAVSGALTAGRYNMDIVGFVLIGTVTGIGGGTIRDLLLGRTVWWTQSPAELILCVVASVITFIFLPERIARDKWLPWLDALGLASFSVVGCHVALSLRAPFVVAVFMGTVTATGGGVIRDILTNTQPMILCGQLYATAALAGATLYAIFSRFFPGAGAYAELAGFVTAFGIRGASLLFDIRTGPPGKFLSSGGKQKSAEHS